MVQNLKFRFLKQKGSIFSQRLQPESNLKACLENNLTNNKVTKTTKKLVNFLLNHSGTKKSPIKSSVLKMYAALLHHIPFVNMMGWVSLHILKLSSRPLSISECRKTTNAVSSNVLNPHLYKAAMNPNKWY